MKNLKNKIFAGMFSLASLGFFGEKNANAQECQTYNHDADEFPEEVICWKKEGFNSGDLRHAQSKAGITIIFYSDKDNDNFHESIKLFNHGDNYGDFKFGYLCIEDFNIEKSAGLIDYSEKTCYIFSVLWNRFYSKKSPDEIIKINKIPEVFKSNKNLDVREINRLSLTKEQLYNLYPNSWSFYGGFGERVKRLINAGKNLDEIKKIVSDERSLWGY